MKTKLIAFSLLFSVPLMGASAHAQSTEEAIGTLIGGSAGAVIGGELDNKGSKAEGQVIGAVVGGTLGYVIGDDIDDRNDDARRAERRGDFYLRDGRAYRTYRSSDGRLVEVLIDDRDPYYYRDGRVKSHPVHGTNPGKGRGKGRKSYR